MTILWSKNVRLCNTWIAYDGKKRSIFYSYYLLRGLVDLVFVYMVILLNIKGIFFSNSHTMSWHYLLLCLNIMSRELSIIQFDFLWWVFIFSQMFTPRVLALRQVIVFMLWNYWYRLLLEKAWLLFFSWWDFRIFIPRWETLNLLYTW